MSRRLPSLPILIAAAILSPSARAETPSAQTPPALRPTRDVDVTYKVPVAGGTDMALLQRLRYSAATHRQRVDLPTSGNWMVVDFTTHRMAMVRDESREIVDMPAPENAGIAGAGAGYARIGDAQIAGIACIEWRTRDTTGAETVACYTADGILLRARNESRVLMEAVSVKYASQDDAVFALPTGYTHATP